jgi:hypothetical protein
MTPPPPAANPRLAVVLNAPALSRWFMSGTPIAKEDNALESLAKIWCAPAWFDRV